MRSEPFDSTRKVCLRTVAKTHDLLQLLAPIRPVGPCLADFRYGFLQLTRALLGGFGAGLEFLDSSDSASVVVANVGFVSHRFLISAWVATKMRAHMPSTNSQFSNSCQFIASPIRA
jgi:hypothetical protein